MTKIRTYLNTKYNRGQNLIILYSFNYYSPSTAAPIAMEINVRMTHKIDCTHEHVNQRCLYLCGLHAAPIHSQSANRVTETVRYLHDQKQATSLD